MSQKQPKSEKMTLGATPFSVRLPKDIESELSLIAMFNHKLSPSEQMREWVVNAAMQVMQTAKYQKFKIQMQKNLQKNVEVSRP